MRPEHLDQFIVARTTLSKVRDVSDFHLNWRSYRQIAVRLVENGNKLEDHERTVVDWLICMADRIGEADLIGEGDLVGD